MSVSEKADKRINPALSLVLSVARAITPKITKTLILLFAKKSSATIIAAKNQIKELMLEVLDVEKTEAESPKGSRIAYFVN